MLKSSKSGITAKSKPAATAKEIAVKPVKNSESASGKRVRAVANGEDRYHLIAAAAYCRAERRGFNGGDAVQDWLEVEAEIDSATYS